MRTSSLLFLLMICSAGVAGENTVPLYAGFRASRILGSYPNRQFPAAGYWVQVGNEMAGRFPGATPAGVWIVSLYQSGGTTQLNFPSSGGSIPNVQFTGTDQNEAYLSRFDTSGVKVWLQVEPGAASMDTLISLVLNRYKKHPSVIGFGVDVEWYFANTNSGGKKLTDSIAQHWEAKVRSIDSTYTLFVKHYAQSWMPPTYRGKILFVDDSQDFNFAGDPFAAMVSEYKSWGTKFSPNPVAFQFGYPADTTWWKKLSDPSKTIGAALLAAIPNTSALFWVDFTVTQIFPITSIPRPSPSALRSFSLEQNFPNPFNPSTTIRFTLPSEHHVELSIYTLIGQRIATIADETLPAGTWERRWNTHAAAGVYLYQLRATPVGITGPTHSERRTMILLR